MLSLAVRVDRATSPLLNVPGTAKEFAPTRSAPAALAIVVTAVATRG
jgi:hypothetical protein